MKLLAGLLIAIRAENEECGPANHKVSHFHQISLRKWPKFSKKFFFLIHFEIIIFDCTPVSVAYNLQSVTTALKRAKKSINPKSQIF